MKLKAFIFIAALACGTVYAQNVDVRDAWARATVKGQTATGAFMKITAKDGAKLVSASSPAAGAAQVHEMKMEGDIMRMRAVQGGLDLPAGKTVELRSGGYHLMLTDLKAPLAGGSTLPLTLVFKDAKGVESKVELKVPVATLAPGAKADAHPAMNHDMHKH